jgi:hypothetical protein
MGTTPHNSLPVRNLLWMDVFNPTTYLPQQGQVGVEPLFLTGWTLEHPASANRPRPPLDFGQSAARLSVSLLGATRQDAIPGLQETIR